MSTSDLVLKVLAEAVDQVSDGGSLVYSMRNLFYAIRQLFLTRFMICPGCGGDVRLREPPDLFVCTACNLESPGEDLRARYEGAAFYGQYDSFTQGFLRRYEKIQGKLKGMYREERGKYSYPGEYGGSSSVDVGGKETPLHPGVGNKVIVVEKAGVYGILTENQFDIRLDAVILSTEGYSVEAGREILSEAEEKGLKVCVLHDYDVNGLLIAETLTRATKRLNVHVEDVVDLGLTWEIVSRLMREKGLIPEPVDLRLGDVSKLEGLARRGVIQDEEHRFLLGRTNEVYDAWKRGEKVGVKTVLARGFRVELNALRPSELIEWLERRLKDLGLGKTLPFQEELDKRVKDRILEDLGDLRRRLVDELADAAEEEVGLDRVRDLLYSFRDALEDVAEDAVEDHVKDLEIPSVTLDELRIQLEEKMTVYWTRIADALASMLARDLEDPVKSSVQEESDEIVEAALEDPDVNDAERILADEIRSYLRRRSL